MGNILKAVIVIGKKVFEFISAPAVIVPIVAFLLESVLNKIKPVKEYKQYDFDSILSANGY